MKSSDSTPRVVLLTLTVIVGVIALGFVPQFELFGMPIRSIDILSDLRDSAADEPVEYEADIERLEQELASMVVRDTVAVVDSLPVLPPVRYEWIEGEVRTEARVKPRSEMLRSVAESRSVAIENFDTLQVTRFDNLVEKLASGEDVRIAFMGDSFVEGDILTSDLRSELQRLFGGRGVGFVACDIPFKTVRRTVKRSSSGWSAYSVMKPKSVPENLSDKFFISGYLARGGAGATTTWSATDAFPTLDSCTRARVLLYSRDTSTVELRINDTIPHSFVVAGDDRLRELYVEAQNIGSVGVKVVDGDILCYGVSLEGDSGVVVDNFSVRSNNGHAIFGTGAAINRQADDMLGYDLVVLQYGLNIMQKGQRGYTNYRKQLCNMITYAERCFPNAAILVLGVSDRWVKSDETGAYESIGSADALTSYQRAAADSTNVMFWNTYEAMRALGGMPQFVANGWAAGDHTHINFAGGRRIAKALVAAIVEPVYELLKEREEEQRRIEEQRQRVLEAQRRQQMQLELSLEATRGLLEGVDLASIDSLGQGGEEIATDTATIDDVESGEDGVEEVALNIESEK